MFPSKKTRTKIRKLLGLIPEWSEIADPVRENSKDRFDFFFKNKSFLKAYIEPSRLSFYEELVDVCSKAHLFDKCNNIADIGCGTGHLLKKINQQHPNIQLLGTDFSSSALEVTKQTIPTANTEIYDIYELNNAFVNQFDILFSTEVLEHLLYPRKALLNLLRYITPSGTLVITVPDGRVDSFRGHINFWSPESWNVFIVENLPEQYTASFFIIENNRTNLAIIKRT